MQTVKIYADKNVPNMLYIRDENTAFDLSFNQDNKPTTIIKVVGKEAIEESAKDRLAKNYMDLQDIQDYEVRMIEAYIRKYGENYSEDKKI